MALCSECKKNIGKELRERCDRVNETLHNAGLMYHATLGAAVGVVNTLLLAEHFDVSRTNIHKLAEGEHRIHAEVGDGKYLTACFHEMPSGRFELVAYVN